MPPDLSPELLRRALSGFGTPFRFFDEIGSTNDEALAWARAGAPEGALVIAERQSAGRGRRGRTWDAEPGSALLFSVVLRPRLEPNRLGVVPLAVGVAVAEALEHAAGLRADVKWPNDVLVDGRKVAGILVESIVGQPGSVAVVAGIGINVTSSPVLDDDAAQPAAAVADVAPAAGPTPPSRIALLQACLAALGARSPLDEDVAAAVIAQANARMSLLGRRVTLSTRDGEIDALACRVQEDGALEVEVDGEPRVVRVGEVRRIRGS